jgi:ADP-heptose:LPS heptosyltransferase
MTIPCLMLARKTLVDARLTTVVQPRYLDQIDYSDIVNFAVPEPDEKLPFLAQLTFWLRRFHEKGYDAVVFHRITRADFPAIVAAFLAGIPYRVGGADKGTSGLLTDLYSPGGREHIVDYHLNLVRTWLELGREEGAKVWPRVVDDAESTVPGYDIVIAPFAQHTKIWATEAWHQLLSHLAGRGLRIALSATPAFARQSAEILERFPQIDDLSETTGTLRDLFATVRRARLLVAVDTGIRHVAAAVGTPCVTLGQGREHLTIQGPYVATERYLIHPVPCAPCGAEPCPLGHLQCVRGITVEEVLQAVDDLASEFSIFAEKQKFPRR